jgi:hypothetical protein
MKRARLSNSRAGHEVFGAAAGPSSKSRGTQTHVVGASALREFVLDLWQSKKITDKDLCVLSHYAKEEGLPFITAH